MPGNRNKKHHMQAFAQMAHEHTIPKLRCQLLGFGFKPLNLMVKCGPPLFFFLGGGCMLWLGPSFGLFCAPAPVSFPCTHDTFFNGAERQSNDGTSRLRVLFLSCMQAHACLCFTLHLNLWSEKEKHMHAYAVTCISISVSTTLVLERDTPMSRHGKRQSNEERAASWREFTTFLKPLTMDTRSAAINHQSKRGRCDDH